MDSSKTAEVLKYVILHANFILDFIFEDIYWHFSLSNTISPPIEKIIISFIFHLFLTIVYKNEITKPQKKKKKKCFEVKSDKMIIYIKKKKETLQSIYNFYNGDFKFYYDISKSNK